MNVYQCVPCRSSHSTRIGFIQSRKGNFFWLRLLTVPFIGRFGCTIGFIVFRRADHNALMNERLLRIIGRLINGMLCPTLEISPFPHVRAQLNRVKWRQFMSYRFQI